MINFLKKHLFIQKYIFKKYSILRIMQILEIKNINFSGSIIDVGSKKTLNNISNFIVTSNLFYADKYSNDPGNINIDLEKISTSNHENYDNLLLLNVLEHIYNFKNCIKNCHLLLKENGHLYGSTPFIFRVHGAPNDFFRYTEQSLEKILKDEGFKNIRIKVICGGLFLSIFNSLSLLTNKLPLISNFLIIIFQFLDFIFEIFSKNNKKIYPIGYFFSANK